jgi:HTH-type transcriptional regulator / antitoxin HipB
MFPIGNIDPMRSTVRTPSDLGDIVRRQRSARGLRQEDLALTSGTGRRFIVELEQGKPSVRLDSTLDVLRALGLRLEVSSGSAGPA